MNKRQVKKAEQKLHLAGRSYQLDKKYSRMCHEENIMRCRKYANGSLPLPNDDDFAELIELGIYTEDEVKKIFKYIKKRK